jgi:cell division protein ZapA
MGQVAITVNGRSYRFDCGDGEEPRLTELADYVKSRLEALAREHGNVGEGRLLLMAALTIADELWDATDGNVAGDTSINTAEAKRRA